MIATLRAAGLLPSLAVAPLILLAYVSYRAHRPVAGSQKMAAA